MFKVQTDQGEYRVSFQHFTVEKRKRVQQGTACFIQQPDETTVIEYARCNPVDNFDKRVGRKLSFARAIQPFEKETRKKFWETYFQYCKQ